MTLDDGTLGEPTAGRWMATEIDEQPAVLAGLLARAPEIGAVGAELARRAPRFVLLAARGTSDHAALYAKYLVETRLGLPAGLASPSSTTLYGGRPALTDVLYLAVSQSGRSDDLIGALTVARECGATTVAVTNAPTSPLAGAAEFTIDIGAGVERAVAATKSYTAELLALYLLLGAVAGIDPGLAAPLPDRAAAVLARHNGSAALTAAAGRYRFADRLITTGRGFGYPTAREAGLKLMETSYLSAQAFSTADLLHGPMAMVDRGVGVLAVVSADAGGRAVRPVVDGLRAAGADVLTVGPEPGTPEAGADNRADSLVVDTAGLPAELAPVLEILPLQRLAWRLALDRGLDPDAPRGLAKETRTP
jgi:glucosamine--fructose-6-phosphate aminotransferase (isomerizing)